MAQEDLLLYWLWLISVSGVANMRNERLIEEYKSPLAVYEADPSEFIECGLLNKAEADLFRNKDLSAAKQILKTCASGNISIIVADSPDFPAQFNLISPKPLVLFVKGNLKLPQERLAISIIGTRNCSSQGMTFAQKLSYSLASLDIPIISGLALGIDAQAHIGALKAGGYTAAFLANGVDYCYPPANKSIYEAICKSGAVVSEYPPTTRPLRGNFHTRNRLISGLSTGVVVVETKEKGGCFITCGTAAEQGKDIFVIPHGLASPYCKGAIDLIRLGAYPISSVNDIIEYYAGRYNIVLKEETKPAIQNTQSTIATSDMPQRDRVLSALGSYPKNISEIAYDCGMSAGEAATVLTLLEIEGKATKLAGSNYIINN